MDLQFHKPEPSEARQIAPYYSMRPNKTCDSGMLDTYLWASYYNTQIATPDDRALLILMKDGGETFTAMPWCREEDLAHYFDVLKTYFNEVLKKPLKIYLADEEAVTALHLTENPDFIVKEEFDLKDYLYDGEKMRTLAGRKYHQKRNQVNKFSREYDGRWEYKSLHSLDHDSVTAFLDDWFSRRILEENNALDSLEAELLGLKLLADHSDELPFKAGCIKIDGKIEAVTVGSFNPLEKMAVISVEKGNPDIDGIYQVINQQFLIHEFPDADIINREDDVGLPGLRQAKESYNPIGYARKYMVLQKDFAGYEKELTDQYEKEIHEYSED